MTTPLRTLAMLCFLVLLAALGMAAIWGSLAIFARSGCAWMALVVAADAALLLRLAAMPGGKTRATLAATMTLIALATSTFTVAAVSIGLAFGTPPPESIGMIDPALALTWWRLNVSNWDVLWLLLALPLAWWMGR